MGHAFSDPFGEVQLDVDRRSEFPFAGITLVRFLEFPYASRRQIARNAAHAEAIGTIWRNRNLDDRIAKAHNVNIALAEMLFHAAPAAR